MSFLCKMYLIAKNGRKFGCGKKCNTIQCAFLWRDWTLFVKDQGCIKIFDLTGGGCD